MTHLPIHVIDFSQAGRISPRHLLAAALVAEEVARQNSADAIVRARVAADTASAFTLVAQPEHAEAALERARIFMAKIPEDDPNIEVLQMLMTAVQSDLLAVQGPYGEATRLRTQLVESIISRSGTLEQRIEYWHHHGRLALASKKDGDFIQALRKFREVIPELEVLEREAEQASEEGLLIAVYRALNGAIANLGALLLEWVRAFERADESAKAAIAECSKELEWLLEYTAQGDVKHSLEELTFEQRSYLLLLACARNLLYRALQSSIEKNDYQYQAVQAVNLAEIALRFGCEPECESILRLAINAANHSGSRQKKFIAYWHLARFAHQRGDTSQSLRHLRDATDTVIREHIAYGDKKDAAYRMHNIASQAMRIVDNTVDGSEAIVIAESIKAVGAAHAMYIGIPGRNKENADRELGTRYVELSQKREKTRLILPNVPAEEQLEYLRQLDEVEQEIAAIRLKIRRTDPGHVRWSDPSEAGISTLTSLYRCLERFGPRTTLWGLLPDGERVWSYTISRERYTIHRADWPTWQHDIEELFHACENGRSHSAILESIARHLLVPVQPRLAEMNASDRLIISPSNGLYTLPFAALPVGDGVLAERVVISYVQGLGVLESCLERLQCLSEAVLCIGNPQRTDMHALPFSGEEATRIACIFGDSHRKSTLLVGDTATVHAFMKHAPQHDVLHIACHAEWPRGNLEHPYLALAPDVDAHDSGDLTDERILWDTEIKAGCLVNLAACRSGHHYGIDSEIHGGLVPAFLLAGAGAVVASIWAVEDRTALHFHTRFYEHLLVGYSPAESLINTQRECQNGGLGEHMKEPAVWAAYIVYGRA